MPIALAPPARSREAAPYPGTSRADVEAMMPLTTREATTEHRTDAAPLRRTAVATLLCVYVRDDARHLDQALRSVVQQELPRGVVSRLYVGIDGPITAALESTLRAHADRI
ncbi:MAG TPA: hypothetical protein VEA81_09720, partial [Burkholderiaceae bacterium]|nr:hypothetical protein [Burkholderiaceae bacterium]